MKTELLTLPNGTIFNVSDSGIIWSESGRRIKPIDTVDGPVVFLYSTLTGIFCKVKDIVDHLFNGAEFKTVELEDKKGLGWYEIIDGKITASPSSIFRDGWKCVDYDINRKRTLYRAKI